LTDDPTLRVHTSDQCAGDVHVFAGEDADDFPPERLCQCRAYTWGAMDRILETYETLEAMWAAPCA
jgi:hypothetical protein